MSKFHVFKRYCKERMPIGLLIGVVAAIYIGVYFVYNVNIECYLSCIPCTVFIHLL